MPAGRPKSIDNSKVFDVAKPGASRPVGTSRPVITNNNTVVDSTVNSKPKNTTVPSAPSVSRKTVTPITINDSTDPSQNTDSKSDQKVTVADLSSTPENSGNLETATEEPVADVAISTVSVAKVETKEENDEIVDPAVEPEGVSESVVDEQVEPKDKTTKSTTPGGSFKRELNLSTQPKKAPTSDVATGDGKDSKEQADTKSDPEGKQTDESEKSDVVSGSDSAAVDMVADASGKSKEEQKAAEEEAKRDAALQELINSKKYVVPLAHDSTKKHGNKLAAIVLVLLLVAIIVAYIAIDAKMVKVDVNLPHHFFKQ